MRNPFTAHPDDLGEACAQHAVFASRITDELAATPGEARNRGRTAKDEPK